MKKTILLLPLLLLSGCCSTPQPRVGLCLASLGGDYIHELRQEFRRSMNQRGFETVIRDADLNLKRQEEQIAAFVKDYQEKKLAALVIMPVDSKAIVPALEKAQEAGLPVFSVSVGLGQSSKFKPVANFGVDDVAAGRISAKLLMAATQNKKGKVLVVSSSHWSSCLARVKGLSDELAASNSQIQLVPLETVSNSIQGISDMVFDVIRKDAGSREYIGLFASLDPVMIASMTARNLNGRESDIRIVGFGGSGASRNAVRDGLIAATIEHSIPDLAEKSAQVIVDYLEKKTVPAENINIPITVFTQADAAAQQAKQRKKEAEDAAKLERIRQSTPGKARAGVKKGAAPSGENSAAPEMASPAKGAEPDVAKTPARETAPAVEASSPATSQKESNVLQNSLNQTDSPQEVKAKSHAAAKKLEEDLSRKGNPQEPEVK